MRRTRANRSAESKEKGTGISESEVQVNQKSIPNSRGEMMNAGKSKANSRQEKNNMTCQEPNAERDEHMQHIDDLHVQHKVNESTVTDAKHVRAETDSIESNLCEGTTTQKIARNATEERKKLPRCETRCRP